MDPDQARKEHSQTLGSRVERWFMRLSIALQLQPGIVAVFLFALVCLVVAQLIVMIQKMSAYGIDQPPSHWRRIYTGRHGIMQAPAFVYQHSNYKGYVMPIFHNISDLKDQYFDDISSLKISKGVVLTLYTEPFWRGKEVTIDQDASYVGDRLNDRAKSLAIEVQAVEPHAVQIFRSGSPLEATGFACPPQVECHPWHVLPRVQDSVYMARNRMMLENLNPSFGCTISHFVRPDGTRIYGMLPQKVHAICRDENYIMPRSPAGTTLQLLVPILSRRVTVTSRAFQPLLFSVRDIISTKECDEVLELAKKERDKQKYGTPGALKGIAVKREWQNVIDRIGPRIAELLGLGDDLMSPPQVTCLQEGDLVPNHYDWMNPTDLKKHRDFGEDSKNFLASVLIPISGGFQGGNLMFPFSRSGHGNSSKYATSLLVSMPPIIHSELSGECLVLGARGWSGLWEAGGLRL